MPTSVFCKRKSLLKEQEKGGFSMLVQAVRQCVVGTARAWRSTVILFTLNSVNRKQKCHYHSARCEPVQQMNGEFAEMMSGAVGEGEGKKLELEALWQWWGCMSSSASLL